MSETVVPWVVKVGGDELVPGPALGQLALWTARQVRRGRPLVLVHGGGDEVTARAAALGIATEKRDGLRVTGDEMLEVVAEVLAGRINVRLTNALEGAGVPAVGLTGVSGRMLLVKPAGTASRPLGWVGEPRLVHTRLLTKLLEEGLTPVVAPLGTDGAGGVYNVNGDLAASALGAALHANVYLVTDVEGVRGRDGRSRPELSTTEARRMIAEGSATDGMLPKLGAALRAVGEGASAVWIGPLSALGEEGPVPGAGTWIGGTARPPTLVVPASRAPGGI
ncbi:MAG: acetylglutamate kinase [Thermoplasmata archaeon]|nr:acetylglutamate kinase [Thermoplasmata archaeon]